MYTLRLETYNCTVSYHVALNDMLCHCQCIARENNCTFVSHGCYLVPRVLRLLGQRVVARKDSEVIKKRLF